ncbi:MAG: excinuclease ABC subunit UvrA [Candidatus Aphodosoma sp.]
MKNENIIIKNAKVHNLKGVDVEIPRNKFVVITGLSGSGKSSLAFDTLYAEGQRRYVESLGSYVRQFLGRMNKPEVDFIKGIPPAIAIEQKVINNNPRSTVGTTTEIYEYLKILFARIGHTFSPISGDEVKRHTVDDVIDFITTQPEGTHILLLTEKKFPEKIKSAAFSDMLKMFVSQGFSRMFCGGNLCKISDLINDVSLFKLPAYLVVDRVKASKSNELVNRLYDSVEAAFFEGNDKCVVAVQNGDEWRMFPFSKTFEADGMVFNLPSDKMFAFNNPLGACTECEGFGNVMGIDADLVIPDKSLSIYDDAIVPWRGPVMGVAKRDLIANADKFNFPIHRPYYRLTEEQKNLLWTGNEYFQGLNDFFAMLKSRQHQIQYATMYARYRGKTICPSCHGTRLKKEATYVKIAGKSICDLVDIPISELYNFFENLVLPEHEQRIATKLLKEITSRLQYLINVGLEYLTLNRQSNTLSGGESQRINLATSLGSALVGSLYILDEPSIGLHPRDTQRLIGVLRQLQQLGNTVVVVEHDEEIMRAADYIIDMGPNAGRNGGRVVMAANVSELKSVKADDSYTLKYLNGSLEIPTPLCRRKSSNYIEVKNATHHNLKNIDVRFYLGIMTVVTGVSGSGKSSLVKDVLYNALNKVINNTISEKVSYGDLTGSVNLLKAVEIVDQNPIGKSSRSNPVTYIKAYDEIRRLFAEQPLAKQMGFTPAYFSFNVDGGRCPVCAGEGTITVPMQFMADIVLPCEACGGSRFKHDVLEVKFHDCNIHDVLEMTINQALEFFTKYNDNSITDRIIQRLKPLQDVGIGYVKLGQSASTLSGGESQRVKLAYFLAQETSQPTMFIFDEPTTGLHSHDINILMKALNALVARGHTVVIIEHNLNVIKCADYIIDIGPEGGEKGGEVVVCGTPEEVVICTDSYTAKALLPLLTSKK